jgi:hypothetical protein
VVTADGELRHVRPRSEPDLYWALLGGKGNFGMVTEFEFEVFPVTRFYGGGLFSAGEHLPRVLEAWRPWLPTVGEETTRLWACSACPIHLHVGHLGPAA